MSRFWPTGIEFENCRTALEILHIAAGDWTSESGDEMSLRIEVLTQKINISAVNKNGDVKYLFSVYGLPDSYPVAIKRSEPLSGPSEFSEALLTRLNAADVKASIYNLLILEDEDSLCFDKASYTVRAI